MTTHDIGNIGMLALLLWRECRGESSLVKLIVAYSVVERVKIGGWWGHNFLDVISHPLQYSSFTAPSDPQLRKWPNDDTVWLDCLTAAQQAYTGSVANPLPGATHYHDISIDDPQWAKSAQFLGQRGRLKFYKAA